MGRLVLNLFKLAFFFCFSRLLFGFGAAAHAQENQPLLNPHDRHNATHANVSEPFTNDDEPSLEEKIEAVSEVIALLNRQHVDLFLSGRLGLALNSADRKDCSLTLTLPLNDEQELTSFKENLCTSYDVSEEIVELFSLAATRTLQVLPDDQAKDVTDVETSDEDSGQEKRDIPSGQADGISRESQAATRYPRYWMVGMESTTRNETLLSAKYEYSVWRNVKDFGARGDGVTDDTMAINRAIRRGGRCGRGCLGGTKKPAFVYFPPGTYLVSSAITVYFNTQLFGDPHQVPTLLAAKRFSGMAVITSEGFKTARHGWYPDNADSLRSVRNFKIDIRPANWGIYLGAIHWRAAPATSLENIQVTMLPSSDFPNNTQHGLYVEEGSAGLFANLTFIGGYYGALFANQQSTTRHLRFVACKNAVLVQRDSAWTMQSLVIENCTRGLLFTTEPEEEEEEEEKAAKAGSQGASSSILLDTIISNTKQGIVIADQSDRAVSFLLINVGFFNVGNAVLDTDLHVLIKGGEEVVIGRWGFGLMHDPDRNCTQLLHASEYVPSISMPQEFLGAAAHGKLKPNLFIKVRPTYYDVPRSIVFNVQWLGAKGDGKSNDLFSLNLTLKIAARYGGIVYFPYGVYMIQDTLKVPVGSRIIGQAWPQIMGYGPKFHNELSPRPVVQVGEPGDVGIVEIQDMMFTASGPTAGAVVVEWNVGQQTKGAAGMWDTHIRVGGAAGSSLTHEQCPEGAAYHVNHTCKAASLLLHLRPNSTAYIENLWAWVADRDLDCTTPTQVDVYAGRGVLIQSRLAYLWAVSSEHAALYQIQLAGASKVLMGTIRTEPLRSQSILRAVQPSRAGLFPRDPANQRCQLRILDSVSVYVLGGAGICHWTRADQQDQQDQQEGHKTGNCQAGALEVTGSRRVVIYNVCTKAVVSVLPLRHGPINLTKDNISSVFPSVLGWMHWSGGTAQRTAGDQQICFGNLRYMAENSVDVYTARVPPPLGTTAAPDTTSQCQFWHIARVEDSCAIIYRRYAKSFLLFLQLNPSLGPGKEAALCSSRLKAGLAYCLHPGEDWKNPNANSTEKPPHLPVHYWEGSPFWDGLGRSSTSWRFPNGWTTRGGLNNGFVGIRKHGSPGTHHRHLEVDGSYGGMAISNDNLNYTDLLIYARMGVDIDKPANAGLVFRVTDVGDGPDDYRGYYVGLGNNAIELGRSDGHGNWTELASEPLLEYAVSTGLPHYSVKISAHGEKLSVECWSSWEASVPVARLAAFDSTYPSGGFGIRSSNMHAQFYRLTLWPVWVDDFDGGLLDDRWVLHGGSFAVESGQLVGKKWMGGQLVVHEVFEDFVLFALLRLDSGRRSEHAGFLLRVSDVRTGMYAFKGYYVGLRGDGFVVLCRADHDWTELIRSQVPVSGRADEFRAIRIETSGSSFAVFVDGEQMIHYEDNVARRPGQAFTRGAFGVRVFNTDATFDDVVLVPNYKDVRDWSAQLTTL